MPPPTPITFIWLARVGTDLRVRLPAGRTSRIASLDWLTRIEFAREADGDCAYIELEETRAVDTLRWRLGRVVGGMDVAVGYAEMPLPRSAELMIVLRLDPSGACSMSVGGLELFGRETAVVGARGGLRLRVPFELDEMDIIVFEELR